jgi:exopolysaccharide biosynthesis polyprenyl glycosylphosphotransferase
MMARIFGHYVSLEMFFLWVVEFSLSFLVLYVLLLPAITPGVPAPIVPGTLPGLPFALVDLVAANKALVLAFAIGITSIALGLYRPEICCETHRLMVNTVVAGLFATPVILATGWLLEVGTPPFAILSTLWPVKLVLAWIAMLLVTRLVFGAAVRLNLFARPIVIVGSDDAVADTRQAIGSLGRGFFRVAGVLRVEPAREDAPPLVLPPELLARRVWGIVVTAAARARFGAAALQQASGRGIRVFGDLEFRERELRRVDLDALDPSWLLSARGVGCSRLEGMVRRGCDILISAAFLVACLPLMALTALLIRLDSPGPVLYRQERVGLYGRPFTLLKFRSMFTDAEARGPIWAATKDSRVTRVGAFIRLTRIDELPQFVNVLRGEMGFIGPRPERPHFIEQLAPAIPRYHDRAYVKPGITGWAQVNFRYGASIEDARTKLSYDLYYVKHRSLILDVMILFATVRVILFQEGAR